MVRYQDVEDSSVDELRVVHILIFMSYGNKELFKKYGSGFVDVVCSMLLTEERMSDQLFGAAIRFLTRVGGKISHYHNENITDQKVKSHIVSCLALFDENPAANWRYKECAIYLVDSLGNRVADVESFFRLYIVPELESQDDSVQTLVDSINSVQANFFDDFLAEFWIPNVKSINGTYKLEDKPYFEIQDPLKEIKDPKRFLLTSLANLSSQFRGRFPPIIIRYLSSANQATLLQLCNSFNLNIV
nr:exportin-2 [Tanacetum cinerariifolium]